MRLLRGVKQTQSRKSPPIIVDFCQNNSFAPPVGPASGEKMRPLSKRRGRCEASGFRIQGSGFRVQGSGFRVQVSGFRVQDSEFRVQGSGFRVQGSVFRVQGLWVPHADTGHLRTVHLRLRRLNLTHTLNHLHASGQLLPHKYRSRARKIERMKEGERESERERVPNADALPSRGQSVDPRLRTSMLSLCRPPSISM